MKKIISGWVPPILLKQVRSLRSPWQGSYNSWAEAKAQTIGYNSEEILQRVSDATREVQSSRKAYERDSILFDEVLYSWPLVFVQPDWFVPY